MERLRILFFLNSVVRAGVEEVVLSLVRGLDRDRFEVHLAAPPPLLQSFAPDLNGCDVRTLAIDLQSVWQFREMRRLAAYLRRERIQIVNSHLFRATLFAAPIARLAGVPVVVETTHGPEAWRRSWWKRKCWVDRCIERLVTANIAVSQANADYLVTRKRYPHAKIHVVPNGRDLARYRAIEAEQLLSLRRRFELRPEDRIVAVVGRLEPQKGHAYLLRALPDVVRRFPTLRVVLVGEGSLRAALQDTVRSNGLEEQVLFAGSTPAVAPFYHLAEFVVLPSLYEGMPLVAIEAGAAGRAVIATDVDGTREVIEADRTGLLVPPACSTALTTAMLSLLTDPGRSRTLGTAAQARVERLFSITRQLEMTSRIYEACCAGSTTDYDRCTEIETCSGSRYHR
jgi:glycosyltransferase involved in cell wall biosynthesis